MTLQALIGPWIGIDPFDLSAEMDVWDEAGFPLPGFPNC